MEEAVPLWRLRLIGFCFDFSLHQRQRCWCILMELKIFNSLLAEAVPQRSLRTGSVLAFRYSMRWNFGRPRQFQVLLQHGSTWKLISQFPLKIWRTKKRILTEELLGRFFSHTIFFPLGRFQFSLTGISFSRFIFGLV